MNFRYFLFLAILLIPIASGYTLSNVTILPDDNSLVGSQISASFILYPSPYEGYTSNPNVTIQIITGLTNPTYIRQMILAGGLSYQTVQSNTLNLEGWDISYLKDNAYPSEQFNISLTGIAPNISSTGQVTILNIAEFDMTGMKIPGTTQIFQKLVVSPTDLQSNIYLAQKDLEKLKLNIEIYRQKGIDISSEQAIYDNSVNGLNLAKNLPTSQYPSGLERLKEINNQIKGAEDNLNRSWTQIEINKASAQLVKLDSVIKWFRNQSFNLLIGNLSENKAFQNITNNRTVVLVVIGQAERAMNAKEYLSARALAANAYALGNLTYTQASALQKHDSDPLNILWDNALIIAGIIAITVLIILFKPKRKRKKKMQVKKDGK